VKRLLWAVLIAGALLAVGFHGGNAAAQQSPQPSRGGQMKADEPKTATKSLTSASNANSAATNAAPLPNPDVKELTAKAEKGDPEAQTRLGLMYYEGRGVARDSYEAMRWWHRAEQQGNAYAKFCLHLFWCTWLNAGEEGRTNAMWRLASMYFEDVGVETNKDEGLRRWHTAAERGDVAAQRALGLVCSSGLFGVPKDTAAAAVWVRKAAEAGNAMAQADLGDIYERGVGVETNLTEAVKCYRKAADQGLAMAQTRLGLWCENGGNVPEDYKEAVKWYRKAAEQNSIVAQNRLGSIFFTGRGEVERDYKESAKWSRRAADQGDAQAQARLGFMYSAGLGVPEDAAEAAKWYRKAAEQGQLAAQIEMAKMYDSGHGVNKDLAEAEKWYRKAADRGSLEGQRNLGWLCYKRASEASIRAVKAALQDRKTFEQAEREAANDPKTAQDYAEAGKWLRNSAEAGDDDPQEWLGELYLKGNGVPEDHREGVKWLRRAANQGNPSGQFSLGQCYEEGKGVAQDFVEAYKWYNLALAQNWPSKLRKPYSEIRDLLAEKMALVQIAEAQRRSSAFVAKQEVPSSEEAPGAMPSDELTPKASGSGFFVTEDGCLLTSYHVVEGANRMTLRTTQGTFPARLVKADKANDVALLKAEGKFPALPIAPSRGVMLGESVFTIGFPNIDLQGFAPKLTKGEVSSLTGAQDDPREFQISVAVQPGNSGGPLVNQHGNVIGIVEARLSDIATLRSTGSLPQNVNYAVKSSVLNVLLESLPEISAKLKEPNPAKDRKFEDVVKEVESAAALVLVY